MPIQPALGDVYVNRLLTNYSAAYRQDPAACVHDQVFPVVPVEQPSGLYFKWPKETFMTAAGMMRAPGTESVGTGLALKQGNYFTHRWSLHVDLPAEIYDAQDASIDIERAATEQLMESMRLRRERLWLNTYLRTGVWNGLGATASGVTTYYDFNPSVGSGLGAPGSGGTAAQFGYGNGHWNAANSLPINDLASLRLAGRTGTGKIFNTFVATADVDVVLRNHPSFIDRIKYGSSNSDPADVTDKAIAALLGVKKYLVAGAIANTAQENLATAFSFMVSNSGLLCYVPDSVSLMSAAPGLIFSWNKFTGSSGAGTRVQQFPLKQIDSVRIEADMYFDMNQTSNDLGIYMTGLLG
jgi:hypothetical protein